MDDQFELNERNQIEPENIPETPPAQPQPEEVQAPPAPARRRRRRRKKRPAWQRMLWKYWPPIRFGLIILAGVLLIWLVFSSIGAMFSGPGETEPNNPPEPSSSEAPTQEPTEAPTLPPTEPPTAAPTDPPDPFAGAVADSWYERTLFVGDFNTAGLQDAAPAGNAEYFCTSYMGVFNWDDETDSDTNFEKQDLLTLLGSKIFDKIVINMGINDCGYPISSLINAYSDMVDQIRAAQPEAKIILCAIMPVSEGYANGRDYFSPENIGSVNAEIQLLADGEAVFYIDATEAFIEANGYLLSSASTDGCHLTAAAYQDWAKLMGVAFGKLGIE